jgi:large subunit ribosomal protein L21
LVKVLCLTIICSIFAPRIKNKHLIKNNYLTMYAIVNIAGQQFKVAKDQHLFVHRLQGDEGASIEFDNVLLVDNGGKITVGAPAVSGAKVSAKIVSHLKGEKVIVFKKKRRKGYKKKNGHRQFFTKIQIENITL